MKLIKKTLIILIILCILLTVTSINAADSVNQDNLTTTQDDQVKYFEDLDNQIKNTPDGSDLNLTDNYKYSYAFDNSFKDGVVISKSITINGNNKYIDGSNLARGLTINYNCNVVIKDLTFKNCFSNDNGGGILLGTKSNLTLYNCKFYNNNVFNANGGAICCEKQTNIDIYNSEFNNNAAIRQSDLEWSKFKKGMGSAICVSLGSTFKMHNSNFKNTVNFLSCKN